MLKVQARLRALVWVFVLGSLGACSRCVSHDVTPVVLAAYLPGTTAAVWFSEPQTFAQGADGWLSYLLQDPLQETRDILKRRVHEIVGFDPGQAKGWEEHGLDGRRGFTIGWCKVGARWWFAVPVRDPQKARAWLEHLVSAVDGSAQPMQVEGSPQIFGFGRPFGEEIAPSAYASINDGVLLVASSRLLSALSERVESTEAPGVLRTVARPLPEASYFWGTLGKKRELLSEFHIADNGLRLQASLVDPDPKRAIARPIGPLLTELPFLPTFLVATRGLKSENLDAYRKHPWLGRLIKRGEKQLERLSRLPPQALSGVFAGDALFAGRVLDLSSLPKMLKPGGRKAKNLVRLLRLWGSAGLQDDHGLEPALQAMFEKRRDAGESMVRSQVGEDVVYGLGEQIQWGLRHDRYLYGMNQSLSSEPSDFSGQMPATLLEAGKKAGVSVAWFRLRDVAKGAGTDLQKSYPELVLKGTKILERLGDLLATATVDPEGVQVSIELKP